MFLTSLIFFNCLIFVLEPFLNFARHESDFLRRRKWTSSRNSSMSSFWLCLFIKWTSCAIVTRSVLRNFIDWTLQIYEVNFKNRSPERHVRLPKKFSRVRGVVQWGAALEFTRERGRRRRSLHEVGGRRGRGLIRWCRTWSMDSVGRLWRHIGGISTGALAGHHG